MFWRTVQIQNWEARNLVRHSSIIYTQLRAFIDYRQRDSHLYYWRSTSKFEVDFVIPVSATKLIGIEVKSNPNPTSRDWKGLIALSEEFKMERRIVVTLGSNRRRTQDGIEILPAAEFLKWFRRRAVAGHNEPFYLEKSIGNPLRNGRFRPAKNTGSRFRNELVCPQKNICKPPLPFGRSEPVRFARRRRN